MITKDDIFQMLKNANIKSDDKVLIHTSLRAVGKIENGADGLIDAFIEYLHDGLFLVPTHTWDEVYGKNSVYNVRKSKPCIGTLSKVAAFRKDGFRSLHPTHSMTGFGKKAKEYLQGEENSTTPAPVKGALNRLYEENGKILLIGVEHNRNTFLHAIDERLNLPNRLSQNPYDITIFDHDGNKTFIKEFRGHCTKGIKTCVSENYPNYTIFFEYKNAVTYTTLGNAKVFICDAKKMTDSLKELWQKAPYDFCLKSEQIPEEFYK